jgi:hypothetical protein
MDLAKLREMTDFEYRQDKKTGYIDGKHKPLAEEYVAVLKDIRDRENVKAKLYDLVKR